MCSVGRAVAQSCVQGGSDGSKSCVGGHVPGSRVWAAGAQTPATASGVSELAKDAGPSGGRRQGLGPEAAGKEDV